MTNKLIIVTTLLILFQLGCWTRGQAQSPSHLIWSTTDGNQYLDATGLVNTTLQQQAVKTTPAYMQLFKSVTNLSTNWEVSNNGGQVDTTNGWLNLQSNGNGFPFLHSRTNPFVGLQDWTVSYKYRYTNSASSGTGIALKREHGKGLLYIHQDDNGQFIALNDNVIWRTTPNTNWHVVSICKTGDEVSVSVDGVQIGKDNVGEPAFAFEIGNNIQLGWPSIWNGLNVEYLRVDVPLHNEVHASQTSSTNPVASTPNNPDNLAKHITTSTKKTYKIAKQVTKRNQKLRQFRVATLSKPKSVAPPVIVVHDNKKFPYTITDLGTLPGDEGSVAYAINSIGVVVGQSITRSDGRGTDQSHAVEWFGGRITDLGTLPGFSSSTAVAVNEAGYIVGTADNFLALNNNSDLPICHGFYWSHGKMYDLNDVSHGGVVSQSESINNKNEVVGILNKPSLPNGDFVTHVFRWQNGSFTDLGAINQYKTNSAGSFNDADWILWHGEYFNHETLPLRLVSRDFLWANGRVIDFQPLPGYDRFHAVSMNNRGQVVGACVHEDERGMIVYGHASIWQDGKTYDLGALPGTGNSTGFAINSVGTVVGVSGNKLFLWHNNKMADLNTLISPQEGWILTEANAINNAGQIAGTGIHFGKKRAYLMTPAK